MGDEMQKEQKSRGELGAGLGALLAGGAGAGLGAWQMPVMAPGAARNVPHWGAMSSAAKRAMMATGLGIIAAPLGGLIGGALASDSPIAGAAGGAIGSAAGSLLGGGIPYQRIKNPKAQLLARLLGLVGGPVAGAALGSGAYSRLAEIRDGEE